MRTAALALLTLALTGAGCAREPADTLLEMSGPTMGAGWRVAVVVPGSDADGALRARLDAAVRDELGRLERLLSTWDPASELSRFNRSHSTEPFAVSADTAAVLRWADELARQTGGAFDVTVGPLVEAWGFGTGDDTAAAPDPVLIERLQRTTGMAHLVLDPDGMWVRKLVPELQCDVSGLVPGYAADRVAALLEAEGLGRFLVDVGGEMVTRGASIRGGPWQIAVEVPDPGRRAIGRIVPLLDAAIATSGDYRNFREVDGQRLSHIVDPRSGHPVSHALASATVVDTRGVRADALATALMVLGPDEGLRLARDLDLAALLIVRRPDGTFENRSTPGFDALGAPTP